VVSILPGCSDGVLRAGLELANYLEGLELEQQASLF
jgi:hypothetical protein